MTTILTTQQISALTIVSFATPLPKEMPLRCIKVEEIIIALDKPDRESGEIAVLLHEATKIETFATLLSAVPASKKQLITTILNMSGEVADFFTVEEMVTAAENHYGRDFSKQKGVAIALLSLSKQRREIITTNTISPAFYYSAIEQKTDKIVDALLNLAEMNTATLKQLTSWIKDIITRDKTDLSNIISELNSALPLAVESERKQRTGKLKELLFIRRYPNWSHRHEAAENIKKGIRANHQITVEYPPFFEGNALTIRATITAQKDIETVRQEIENASESLTKLLAIVLGEK